MYAVFINTKENCLFVRTNLIFVGKKRVLVKYALEKKFANCSV